MLYRRIRKSLQSDMRNRQKIVLFLFAVLIFIPFAKSKSAQQKPNILFLFADDQRADVLGCYGNSNIQTPNIDKLASEGVQFTNSYVMGGHHGAICMPSRAMLMSGKSLFHVYDRLSGVKTMPMHFAENGYITFATGKWHNEKAAFEASFQQGKDVFLGGMSDHFKVPCRQLVNGKLGEPEMKGYSTDVFTSAAIGFIEEYSKSGREKPFFCYFAFTAPHDPRSPRPDYIGRYIDESVPLPGNYKPLHSFAFDELTVRDENLAPWPRKPEIIRASLADYYALNTHLDDKIGEIIASLQRNGLYENTIIVYAADNGLAIGSHGLLGKQNLYEHSTKVPVIIAGPAVPKDKIQESFAYLYDLYPTLCNICNLPQPAGIDGQNLFPLMKGETSTERKLLYTVYRNTVRAVRTKEWKLIRYPQQNYSQLFNLKTDPLEINNLAYLPEFKDKLSEMNAILLAEYNVCGDTMNLNPTRILPMEYDFTKLKQKPDEWQPEYILNKYFKDN